jgi:hypothetical protein
VGNIVKQLVYGMRADEEATIKFNEHFCTAANHKALQLFGIFYTLPLSLTRWPPSYEKPYFR